MTFSRASLLLVDDRPENLLALEAILEPLHCNLVRANSGLDALKHLMSGDIALILMDVQMPEMDGFETATMIKEREKTRHIPIIFITALSTQENYVFQGYSAGAVDYIAKPYNPDILRSKVSVFVDLWQKTQEIRRQGEMLREAERRDEEARSREKEAQAQEREREVERRHVAALSASEARFRRVVEANIFGVAFWNEAGFITEANNAFWEMTGYNGRNLQDEPLSWLDMIPNEFRAVEKKARREMEKRGVSAAYEIECLHENGSHVPVLFCGASLESHASTPEDAREKGVYFVVDITKRKQAEASLLVAKESAESAREIAERASRAKSEFISGVSHELRTPLNAIIGFSKLMLNPRVGPLNEDQSSCVKDVVQSAEHLLQIINDLLDLSKIEAGKMTLDMGKFSLPELLEQSLFIVRDKVQAHNLQLSVDIALEVSELPYIEGDQRKVKQVLFNLLSNAVKFTGDGGSITVRATLAREQNAVVVSVEDTGIGIDPEHQERIFAPFEQVDVSYARHQQGTGLGLPLTRRIIEMHGGRLWLQSAPGEGSTFCFTIPLYVQEENPESSQEGASMALSEAG